MSSAAPYMAQQAKRRRQVITPEGIALPFTVATRIARAGALILDLAILFFISIIISIFLSELGDRVVKTSSGFAELLEVFHVILLFFMFNGYFLLFEMGPRGATWGKRAAGIRVASRDGGRLTPESVVARNILRDIEIFLPITLMFWILIFSLVDIDTTWMWLALIWFAVFIFFPFFNKDAMRAGDIIAGTWVVEAPKAKLQVTLSTEGAAAGTSEITGAKYEFGEDELSIYGEYELQTLERVLRENRPEAISSVAETICTKIGWNTGHGDEHAFLEAFYAQLRARLEGGMRFGKRKSDKFS